MNPTLLLADAAAVVSLLDLAVKTAMDVTPMVTSLYNIVINKQPLTDAERADLMSQETQLRATLNSDSLPGDEA
jgi:hypothetical protein